MLDNLTQRMAQIVKKLRGESRLTETNMQDILREIRLSLLEADVALSTIQYFIENVRVKALGQQVIDSVTPGQTLIAIVQQELTMLMGGNFDEKQSELNLSVPPPAIILLAGLHGAGKTTTVAKLARLLRETHRKKVLTVSCDIYRPAAIDQLYTVTKQVGTECFPSLRNQTPLDIACEAAKWAKKKFYDVLIVDTAGRIGIDQTMMEEICNLNNALKPADTLFVIDAMLGQDAIKVAKLFNDTLPITGIILTKLDGDSRGGAALSVYHIIQKPIKFVGISEKLDGIEIFHPSRMAKRILGMGDMLTLVENAQRDIDLKAAKNLTDRVRKTGEFDLNDFLIQLEQTKNMGGFSILFSKLPSQLQPDVANMDIDSMEKQIIHMTAIIRSMTPRERSKPELIKSSRKRRIATGAGVQVQDINRMLNQFEKMRGIMKKLKGNGIRKIINNMIFKIR